MDKKTEAKKAMLKELIGAMDKQIKKKMGKKKVPLEEISVLAEPKEEKPSEKKEESEETEESEESSDEGLDKFRAALKKMRE